VVTAPLFLRAWPQEIAYERVATVKASTPSEVANGRLGQHDCSPHGHRQVIEHQRIGTSTCMTFKATNMKSGMA
jgi:hypothetical protein